VLKGARQVSGAEANGQQCIGALMQRVLIVATQPSVAKLLSDLLRCIGHCQIWTAADPPRALDVARTIEPHLIFVEHDGELDGIAFTRSLRRSYLASRKAAVIVVSAQATTAAIIGARDAGAHEFLRRPYTINDVTRRLEAVARRPRDWIEGVDYVGPDRRRFNAGDYAGPLRRRVDHARTPDEARILQALRNLRSALAALDRDPRQALRSMQAQTDALSCVAKARSDLVYRSAVGALAESICRRDIDTLDRAEIRRAAAPLLAFLPDEQGQTAA
jgi:DNA-binding response OmpR family regulator